MPQERLTMRKIHEILRLHWECKLSNRKIATSCSVGRATVDDYIHRAKAAGLSWPLPDEIDDAQLERLLFPARVGRPQSSDLMPDFVEIHEQLKRKGMTLALLWERYKEAIPDGFNYSHYCDLYRQWE